MHRLVMASLSVYTIIETMHLFSHAFVSADAFYQNALITVYLAFVRFEHQWPKSPKSLGS